MGHGVPLDDESSPCDPRPWVGRTELESVKFRPCCFAFTTGICFGINSGFWVVVWDELMAWLESSRCGDSTSSAPRSSGSPEKVVPGVCRFSGCLFCNVILADSVVYWEAVGWYMKMRLRAFYWYQYPVAGGCRNVAPFWWQILGNILVEPQFSCNSWGCGNAVTTTHFFFFLYPGGHLTAANLEVYDPALFTQTR